MVFTLGSTPLRFVKHLRLSFCHMESEHPLLKTNIFNNFIRFLSYCFCS